MPSPADTRGVADALLEAGALGVDPDSPVTFASGLRSPVYVDCRRLPFHPVAWRTVIEACATHIRATGTLPEVVSAVESAGIPHGSALAWQLGLPFAFVRKQAKAHGTGRRIEGGDVRDHRVLLIEDMITTGGSSLSAIEALRAAGARVDTCLAIVSYAFPEALARFVKAGVRVDVLVSVRTLVERAAVMGQLDERGGSVVEAWLADPVTWEPG